MMFTWISGGSIPHKDTKRETRFQIVYPNIWAHLNFLYDQGMHVNDGHVLASLVEIGAYYVMVVEGVGGVTKIPL